MSLRNGERADDALRNISIETNVNRYAEGSCRIVVGETQVLCTASIEDRVPPFLANRGEGWITAEYAMLPRATHERTQRERPGGKSSGRTQEIQRLVGRALRAVVDRKSYGERSIVVDCDVLQADGGTRCASITGGFVALALAFQKLSRDKKLIHHPFTDQVAAISTGIVAGDPLLDLDYAEDSAAEVDLNVIKTGAGRYVELQGTAETKPFSRERLNQLLDLADRGLERLFELQAQALGQEAIDRLVRKI